MKKLALFALAAASAVVVGCSMLGHASFEQPEVHLRDVKLRSFGTTGGNLDVVLSVYNPNHFRLDATKLTYVVSMANDSVKVADGELASRFTVQDRDSTLVTIPVSFTYAGLGAAGASLRNTGAVNYRVSGDVTVGTPIGNFTRGYSSTGRFTTMGATR
jgi:LEA14-like dessication related protein